MKHRARVLLSTISAAVMAAIFGSPDLGRCASRRCWSVADRAADRRSVRPTFRRW